MRRGLSSAATLSCIASTAAQSPFRYNKGAARHVSRSFYFYNLAR